MPGLIALVLHICLSLMLIFPSPILHGFVYFKYCDRKKSAKFDLCSSFLAVIANGLPSSRIK